ncbi:MAG TPA: hypothetical protein VLM40_06245 [Gemmata sp.]|nr:hypothetical protein [Gemmata sp.]
MSSKPGDTPVTTTDPMLKFPEVEIPKNLGPLPKVEKQPVQNFPPIPPIKDPTANQSRNGPSLAAPSPAPAPHAVTNLPQLPVPGGAAIPSVAPAFPDPVIPSPSVPVIPDPAKPESLPSLTLPPDVPVKRDSTSRSSPLTSARGGMSVKVLPVATQEPPRGVYRAVGFYNHTNRDLNLTIEGRAVKLPARMYLYAQVAPPFSWSHGDQPIVRQKVPDGAAGLDVVFRD